MLILSRQKGTFENFLCRGWAAAAGQKERVGPQLFALF